MFVFFCFRDFEACLLRDAGLEKCLYDLKSNTLAVLKA